MRNVHAKVGRLSHKIAVEMCQKAIRMLHDIAYLRLYSPQSCELEKHRPQVLSQCIGLSDKAKHIHHK
jgi:hypothetical protein